MPGSVAHTGHMSARAKTARNGGDNDQAPVTNRDGCRPDRVHSIPTAWRQNRPNDSPCVRDRTETGTNPAKRACALDGV
eukprot:8660682-Lingulodinium_polyedra.AAC.1